MAHLCHQPGDAMPGNRVMVIGQDVLTVQLVSRYCLEQGAEVFPYYGVPTLEDVTLFDPEISILCLPLPKSFLCNINRQYIIWSEQPINLNLPSVSSKKELASSLQLVLH